MDMNIVDDPGVFYVRQNGVLYLYKNESSLASSKLRGTQLRTTTMCDVPDSLSAATCQPAAFCHSDGKFRFHVRTLFSLCIEYISQNITNVDSLVHFPEMIGEKIFRSLKSSEVLMHVTDCDCAKILLKFNDAYGSLVLSELQIKSLPVLEQHMDAFTVFFNLVKLDITGCHIGDAHNFLLFTGSLSLLTHLSLQDTALSDDGLRRLTAAMRMYGRGPTQLSQLDISYNHRITEKCGRFLCSFRCLKMLCLTSTAVKMPAAARLASQLGLVLSEGNASESAQLDCRCSVSKGWAADVIDGWSIDSRSLAASNIQPTMMPTDNPNNKLETSRFYSKRGTQRLCTVPIINVAAACCQSSPSNAKCILLVSPKTGLHPLNHHSPDPTLNVHHTPVSVTGERLSNRDGDILDCSRPNGVLTGNYSQILQNCPSISLSAKRIRLVEEFDHTSKGFCEVEQCSKKFLVSPDLSQNLLSIYSSNPEIGKSLACNSRNSLWEAMNSERW